MNKNRIDGFTDGVAAIIVTIMVLEMKAPHEPTWAALSETMPIAISYVLSFVAIAVYWVNHHHLMHATPSVNSRIMWSNFILLFFLSLVPFTTKWMGETNFDKIPVFLYALNFVFAGLAYYALQQSVVLSWPHEAKLLEALRQHGRRGKITGAVYVIAAGFALFYPSVSALCFLLTNAVWFIPDRNIERALNNKSDTAGDVGH